MLHFGPPNRFSKPVYGTLRAGLARVKTHRGCVGRRVRRATRSGVFRTERNPYELLADAPPKRRQLQSGRPSTRGSFEIGSTRNGFELEAALLTREAPDGERR